MTNTVFLCGIFLAVAYIRLCVAFEYFLANISGEVENGNFMYYSLSHEGTILLELISLTGDCDLYVSEKRKNPYYEPDSNCLQSVTCGIDSIIIPKSFKRPVGIGVFGHPSHEACVFNLALYRIHDSRDIFNYDSYEASLDIGIDNQLNGEDLNSFTSEQEESFFWVFLRSAVVFLIEIIL